MKIVLSIENNEMVSVENNAYNRAFKRGGNKGKFILRLQQCWTGQLGWIDGFTCNGLIVVVLAHYGVRFDKSKNRYNVEYDVRCVS